MASIINASTSSGIVQTADTSGVLQLQTASTTAVTVDASQNVGIGTTSPATKLDISGGAAYTYMRIIDTRAANPSYIGSEQGNTVFGNWGAAERMRIDSSGNVGVGVAPSPWNSPIKATQSLYSGSWSNTSASSCFYSNVYRGASYSAFYITTAVAGELGFNFNGVGEWAFSTAPSGSSGTACTMTERMRIENTGNVLIGYTSSNGAYKLQVNSQIFATSSTIATSDARYKTDVTPILGALDIVNSLNPVEFNWKEHPVHAFDTTNKTVGFLAQEVQEVLKDKLYVNSIIKKNDCVIKPEEKDKDGNVTKEAVTEEFLGIAEGNMIAILTKAIQEQQTIINDLKARITALEGAK